MQSDDFCHSDMEMINRCNQKMWLMDFIPRLKSVIMQKNASKQPSILAFVFRVKSIFR